MTNLLNAAFDLTYAVGFVSMLLPVVIVPISLYMIYLTVRNQE